MSDTPNVPTPSSPEDESAEYNEALIAKILREADTTCHCRFGHPRIGVADVQTLVRMLRSALSENARLKQDAEQLRRVAQEMFNAVASGHRASIGSIDNTYLPQIGADTVARWCRLVASALAELREPGSAER